MHCIAWNIEYVVSYIISCFLHSITLAKYFRTFKCKFGLRYNIPWPRMTRIWNHVHHWCFIVMGSRRLCLYAPTLNSSSNQGDVKIWISAKYQSNCNNFHAMMWIWKCRLLNGSYSVSAWMCKKLKYIQTQYGVDCNGILPKHQSRRGTI